MGFEKFFLFLFLFVPLLIIQTVDERKRISLITGIVSGIVMFLAFFSLAGPVGDYHSLGTIWSLFFSLVGTSASLLPAYVYYRTKMAGSLQGSKARPGLAYGLLLSPLIIGGLIVALGIDWKSVSRSRTIQGRVSALRADPYGESRLTLIRKILASEDHWVEKLPRTRSVRDEMLVRMRSHVDVPRRLPVYIYEEADIMSFGENLRANIHDAYTKHLEENVTLLLEECLEPFQVECEIHDATSGYSPTKGWPTMRIDVSVRPPEMADLNDSVVHNQPDRYRINAIDAKLSWGYYSLSSMVDHARKEEVATSNREVLPELAGNTGWLRVSIGEGRRRTESSEDTTLYVVDDACLAELRKQLYENYEMYTTGIGTR